MADFGQGVKGAVGGGLAGSTYGVPGIIAGGALGFLGGLGSGPSDEEKANQKRLEAYYAQLQGREAPQMGQAAQSGYSDFRQNQTGLVNRLEAMANGQGPSVAAQQFKVATDRNMAGQQAMANSGRGGPLAAMTAANNVGLLGAQAAQGSALGRVQEQQNAIQQLSSTISQGRGSDEANNQFNAGAQNDTARANLESRLRTMGLNDDAILAILQQMGGSAQNQAARPGEGDAILAGGAGMYAMGAGQSAQQRASGAVNGITSRPGYPGWGGR